MCPLLKKCICGNNVLYFVRKSAFMLFQWLFQQQVFFIFNFSFWNNTNQNNYFKHLKEASIKSLRPSIVHLALYSTSLSQLHKHLISQCFAQWVWCDQRSVDEPSPPQSSDRVTLPCFLVVPSLSQWSNLSVPLISSILRVRPNCLNPAVTSLMLLLSLDLLVFPFTDVLSLVPSTAKLIKAPVLWWSSFLLHIARLAWQILTYCTFWPRSPLHSCVWNSSLHLLSHEHNFLSRPIWLTSRYI